MFDRTSLDSLFDELKQNWEKSSDFEQLSRDAHLGIALSDAGSALGDNIDTRVVALIEKHKPSA